MSTHASISVRIDSNVLFVKTADEAFEALAEVRKPSVVWKTVYVHFDGDRVGQILDQHFATQELAESLVNANDLRSIDPTGAVERYDEDPARFYPTAWASYDAEKWEYNYFWTGKRWARAAREIE